MASIRNLGACPCPRCKVPLSEVALVGKASDRHDRSRLVRVDDHRRKILVSTARRAILERNLAMNSAYVERLLKPESLVPTAVSSHLHHEKHNSILSQNAFSDRLGKFLNLFSMFVVDFLHDVEIGSWRALLIHLLRILNAVDENLVHELDRW
jgi:hypothetical protein